MKGPLEAQRNIKSHSHSEFLNAVAECVQDGVLILDVNGRVLYSNAAAKKIFNVQSEDFPDLDLGISLSSQSTNELHIKTGDNEVRTIELKVLRHCDSTEAFYVLGARDITYVRQLEKQIKQVESELQDKFSKQLQKQIASFEEERKKLYFRLNENRFREKRLQDRIWILEEEAKSLLQEKQELEVFGHIAGHDLKDSLRSLMMSTDFLVQHPVCQNNQELYTYREMIRRYTSHLMELLRDIQAFTRIQNSEKEWTHFSLAKACEQAVESVQEQLKKSKAVIKINPLPWAHANFELLVTVFQNLISNGIKFKKDQLPELEISSSFDPKTSQYSVCVRDNGIGIHPRYHDRLFHIFSRLVRREEYPGSGLGLAICRKIIEGHRGRIWLESAPGEGTSFYFSMPSFYIPNTKADETHSEILEV